MPLRLYKLYIIPSRLGDLAGPGMAKRYIFSVFVAFQGCHNPRKIPGKHEITQCQVRDLLNIFYRLKKNIAEKKMMIEKNLPAILKYASNGTDLQKKQATEMLQKLAIHCRKSAQVGTSLNCSLHLQRNATLKSIIYN